MAKPKLPDPIPHSSAPAVAVAPTSGMWRNENAQVNGAAPANGGAK